jgi:hypothetical protein
LIVVSVRVQSTTNRRAISQTPARPFYEDADAVHVNYESRADDLSESS